MFARPPTRALVVLLVVGASPVAAVATPTAGPAPTPAVARVPTAAPTAAPSPDVARRPAVPAPICSVPADAGVLALVPPGATSAGGDARTDTPSAATDTPDPGVGTTRTAVVDRFEGDTAVLLVEARGDVVARRHVRRAALPRAARHQDAVVTVTVVADAVAAITYRPVETVRRSRSAARRFDRLSEPAPDRSVLAVC